MKKNNEKKVDVNKVITIITIVVLTFVFFVMPLQKGGFFKQDLLIFNTCIFLVSIVILVVNLIKNGKNKEKKENFNISLIDLLILLLVFAFFLPYFLGKSISINDALFEAIKYGAFCNIYFLTKWLIQNKNIDLKENRSINILTNVIVIASVVISILGIDQIGARFFEGMLNNFNIYYLAEITTRLSSTMQYANGTAAFLVIGMFFSIYQYFNTDKNSIKKIYVLAIFMQLVAVIFSASRAVMLVLGICLIVLMLVLKKNKKYDYLFIGITTIVLAIIFCTLGINLINIGKYLLLWFTLISFLIFIYFTLNCYMFFKEKIYNISKKSIYIAIGIATVSFIFLGIIAINISSPLTVFKNNIEENVKIVRQYSYITKNEDYNIKLDISEITDEIGFNMEVLSVDDKGSYTFITSKTLEDLKNNNYEFNIKTLDKTKNLCFIFNVNKGEGSFKLNSIILNENRKKVNYALLDYDTFYRLDIFSYIDQSINERMYITKDSIKIWLENPVIGIGGEGFKYVNQQIQSYPYASTKTHSYITDILIDTGIIGLLIYVSIVVLVIYIGYRYIKKNKDDELYKILFILFIFLITHSIIDLDFSFAINIYIFAYIIALLTTNKDGVLKKNKDISNNSRNLYIVCGIIANIVMFCITTSSLVAYYMKIPVYEDKSVTIENEKKTITKMESRVKLDKYETLYMQKLNKEYTKYKSLLIKEYNNKSKNSKEEIANEVSILLPKIKANIDNLYNYAKYDSSVFIDIANTYFTNFINFASLDELKENKDYYIYKAIGIIKKMESPLNISLYEKKATVLYNYYTQIADYELKESDYNKEKILADLKNSIIIIPQEIEENYINKKLELNSEALKNIYQIIDKINEKGVL